MEAETNGYSEGIALDTFGYVSEGSGENIFVVRDGEIYTPPLSASILPGITRDMVMEVAQDLGYRVSQENIPREMLYIADEVFFVGTAVEITPIRSVDKIMVGSGRRGPDHDVEALAVETQVRSELYVDEQRLEAERTMVIHRHVADHPLQRGVERHQRRILLDLTGRQIDPHRVHAEHHQVLGQRFPFQDAEQVRQQEHRRQHQLDHVVFLLDRQHRPARRHPSPVDPRHHFLLERVLRLLPPQLAVTVRLRGSAAGSWAPYSRRRASAN